MRCRKAFFVVSKGDPAIGMDIVRTPPTEADSRARLVGRTG